MLKMTQSCSRDSPEQSCLGDFGATRTDPVISVLQLVVPYFMDRSGYDEHPVVVLYCTVASVLVGG